MEGVLQPDAIAMSSHAKSQALDMVSENITNQKYVGRISYYVPSCDWQGESLDEPESPDLEIDMGYPHEIPMDHFMHFPQILIFSVVIKI